MALPILQPKVPPWLFFFLAPLPGPCGLHRPSMIQFPPRPIIISSIPLFVIRLSSLQPVLKSITNPTNEYQRTNKNNDNTNNLGQKTKTTKYKSRKLLTHCWLWLHWAGLYSGLRLWTLSIGEGRPIGARICSAWCFGAFCFWGHDLDFNRSFRGHILDFWFLLISFILPCQLFDLAGQRLQVNIAVFEHSNKSSSLSVLRSIRRDLRKKSKDDRKEASTRELYCTWL